MHHRSCYGNGNGTEELFGVFFRCMRLNAQTQDFVCPKSNADSTPPRKKREAQIGLITKGNDMSIIFS